MFDPLLLRSFGLNLPLLTSFESVGYGWLYFSSSSSLLLLKFWLLPRLESLWARFYVPLFWFASFEWDRLFTSIDFFRTSADYFGVFCWMGSYFGGGALLIVFGSFGGFTPNLSLYYLSRTSACCWSSSSLDWIIFFSYISFFNLRISFFYSNYVLICLAGCLISLFLLPFINLAAELLESSKKPGIMSFSACSLRPSENISSTSVGARSKPGPFMHSFTYWATFFLTKLLLRMSTIVGLLLGLIYSILLIKSLSYLLYIWLIGGKEPLRIFTASPLMDWASKACLRLHISYKTHPNAQTSDL